MRSEFMQIPRKLRAYSRGAVFFGGDFWVIKRTEEWSITHQFVLSKRCCRIQTWCSAGGCSGRKNHLVCFGIDNGCLRRLENCLISRLIVWKIVNCASSHTKGHQHDLNTSHNWTALFLFSLSQLNSRNVAPSSIITKKHLTHLILSHPLAQPRIPLISSLLGPRRSRHIPRIPPQNKSQKHPDTPPSHCTNSWIFSGVCLVLIPIGASLTT